MTETVANVQEIFERYGLEVEEVEPAVYKVLNTDKTISIDELQRDLDCCVLITSGKLAYKKLNTGLNAILLCVYYIILDYDDRSIGNKYRKLATERFGESLVMPYKNKHIPYGSIDTIYAKGEI